VPPSLKAPDARAGFCICAHSDELKGGIHDLNALPPDTPSGELIAIGAGILIASGDALLDARNDAYEVDGPEGSHSLADMKHRAERAGLIGAQAIRFIPVFRAAHAYFQALNAAVAQE
jgi:hypothetical protein